MTGTYRAAVCTALDGPTAIECRMLEAPPLGPNDIRIAVRAAGANFPDLLMTRGGYQFRPDPPFVPGMEVAGDVLEVGSAITAFKAGDRVMGQCRLGGFAEQAIVTTEGIMPLPPALTYEEGAAWFVAATTAWHALNDKGQVKPGETLLVLGASGGVGMAAVQLGKHMGAKVIGLASNDDKVAALLKAGADHAFRNDTPDLVDAIKAATGGKGVDIVYDPVGGPLAITATRTLGWGGRFLIVGFASGEIPKFPANHALIKSYTIMGLRAGESARRDPELGRRNRAALVDLANKGVMRPMISHRFPLEQAGDALRVLENREVIGRAVVTP